MIFYLSIAFLLFFLCIFDFRANENLQVAVSVRMFSNQMLLVFTVTLVLFGGFRWLTGTDWISYSRFFLTNSTWAEFRSWLFEPGYTLLNYAVKRFSDSYTSFLFAFHFLVIVPKICVIRKVAYYPLVSVLLYWCIYTGEIVAVRNSLGVSFLLLSVFAMQNKNKKQFVFFILLATSIHYSCALWIFSYYIYHLNISSTKWKKLIIISLFFAVTGKYIYPSVIRTIFSPFNFNPIVGKIIFYATSFKDANIPIQSRFLSLVKRCIFIPFVFLYYQRLVMLSPYNKGIINLYLFGNIFYLAFFSGFSALGRCIIANLFLEVILLPEFLLCIKRKYAKMFFLFIILLYGLFKMVTALKPFSDVLIPYYTIFNYQPRIMY